LDGLLAPKSGRFGPIDKALTPSYLWLVPRTRSSLTGAASS